MDSSKLISCTGYALRMSRHLDVPEATRHLGVALYYFRLHAPRTASSNTRHVISLHAAIGFCDETRAVDSEKAGSAQPGGTRLQDAMVQTEAEMITRQMCEKLMYGLQNKFEEVAENWRLKELDLRNHINRLQESLRSLGSAPTESISCPRDADQSQHDCRPADTGSMVAGAVANTPASGQHATLQQLRSAHTAARMKIKQQRREERRQAMADDDRS